MMSAGPTPKRLRQSILKFSRSTPAGSFPHPLREVNTPQLSHNTPRLQGERREREEGEGGEKEGTHRVV